MSVPLGWSLSQHSLRPVTSIGSRLPTRSSSRGGAPRTSQESLTVPFSATAFLSALNLLIRQVLTKTLVSCSLPAFFITSEYFDCGCERSVGGGTSRCPSPCALVLGLAS